MKKLIGILCLTVAVLQPAAGFSQEPDGLGASSRYSHPEREQKESSGGQEGSRPQAASPAQTAPAGGAPAAAKGSGQAQSPAESAPNMFLTASSADLCDANAECKKYYDLYTHLYDDGRFDQDKVRDFYNRFNKVACNRAEGNSRKDRNGPSVCISMDKNAKGPAPLLSKSEWYDLRRWEGFYKDYVIERNQYLVGYQSAKAMYDKLKSAELSSSQLKDALKQNASDLFQYHIGNSGVKIRVGDAIAIYLGEDKLNDLVGRENELKGKEKDGTVRKSLEQKGEATAREFKNLVKSFDSEIPNGIEKIKRNKDWSVNTAVRPDFMAAAEPVAVVAAAAPAEPNKKLPAEPSKGAEAVPQTPGQSAILGSIKQGKELDKHTVPPPPAGAQKPKSEPKAQPKPETVPAYAANLTVKEKDGVWKCSGEHWCTEKVNSKGDIQEVDWLPNDKNQPKSGAYLKVLGKGKLIPIQNKDVYRIEGGPDSYIEYKAPGEPARIYQVTGSGIEINKSGPKKIIKDTKDGKEVNREDFVARLKGDAHLPNLRFVPFPNVSKPAEAKAETQEVKTGDGKTETKDGSPNAENTADSQKQEAGAGQRAQTGDSKAAATDGRPAAGGAAQENDKSLIFHQTDDGHTDVLYPRHLWSLSRRKDQPVERVSLWKWDGNDKGGNVDQVIWNANGLWKGHHSKTILEKGVDGIAEIHIFLDRKNVDESVVILTRSNGSKEKRNLLTGDPSPENEAAIPNEPGP